MIVSIIFFFLGYFFDESVVDILVVCLSLVSIIVVLVMVKQAMLLSDKQKNDDFIAKTLHELNTPLATIQLNTQLIKSRLENEKQKDRCSRIEMAVDDLMQRYKNVERFIKNKSVVMTHETCLLKPFLLGRIELLQGRIKNQDILCECDDNVVLFIDKIGLAMVVDNLLTNALKNTPANGWIQIKFSEGILSISDNGVGIESYELVRIFESYYQHNHSKEGLGLGLTLVKEFCDHYKIGLKVTSQEARGTIWYLDLKSFYDIKE